MAYPRRDTWQDTEPDMSANLSELFGEPVSDRRTTAYSSAYFRD